MTNYKLGKALHYFKKFDSKSVRTNLVKLVYYKLNPQKITLSYEDTRRLHLFGKKHGLYISTRLTRKELEVEFDEVVCIRYKDLNSNKLIEEYYKDFIIYNH